MNEDRIQIPCLEENRLHGKKYNYRQKLKRFKQFKKRKYDTDIRPLIKEETMTGTEWDTKEARLSLGIGTRSNTSNKTVRRPNQTGEN